MHLNFSLLVSAIAVSSAFASVLPRQDVPACAVTCIASADLDGCSATDNVCLCESQTFIDSVETCFDDVCEGQDLDGAREFVDSACEAVGVPVPTATEV